MIAYSWGGLPESTGRWLQPAIYWSAPVRRLPKDLCDLSAKITLASTLIGSSSTATSLMSGTCFHLKRLVYISARESPWWDPEHNICGAQHSGTYAGREKSGFEGCAQVQVVDTRGPTQCSTAPSGLVVYGIANKAAPASKRHDRQEKEYFMI